MSKLAASRGAQQPLNANQFLEQQYRGKSAYLLGGAGQVGGYLRELLERSGAKATVVDRKPLYDPLHNLEQDFISDADNLRSWLRADMPDYVFNLAAKVTGVTYNESHHFEMALENALLQAIPLWACRGLKTRFTQFSTVCVLPRNAAVPSKEWLVQELDSLGGPEPTNFGYGLAKRWGEHLCNLAMTDAPDLKPLIVRPSNLYGREDPRDLNGHVIPRLVWRLMNREDPLSIRGLSTTRRTFMHARDCAEAVAILAATDYVGTVNVGTHDEVSIVELLNILCEIERWSPGMIVWGYASEQGYERRAPDLSLFNSILSGRGVTWSPPTSLRDGLEEYVRWAHSLPMEIFSQAGAQEISLPPQGSIRSGFWQEPTESLEKPKS